MCESETESARESTREFECVRVQARVSASIVFYYFVFIIFIY